MSHTHALPPATNRVDMVIPQGKTWEWASLLAFGDFSQPQPDLSTYTGTYVVFPHQDTTQTPVIKLGTSAGMTITYNDGNDTTTTSTGCTLGVFGFDEVATTLSAGASKGESTITLTSATDAVIGRHIVIWLDSGDIHITSISGLAGSVATLAVPLSGDAASGNVVKHFDGDWMLCNILLSLSASTTKALTPWGQGLYQLDIIDSFGHVLPLDITGLCCLERGSGHE